MPESSQVFEEKLKHVGLWSFKEVYNFCYEWLKDQDYLLSEDRYQEKILENGKEIKIEWTAKKKVSDYFRNVIKLKWHILGLNDAEAEINGKKKKTNKGEIKIQFTAELERDYESRWEDKPLWKFFRSIYDKYIVRTTIDEYEDRLAEKIDSLVDDVKAFLVLEGQK